MSPPDPQYFLTSPQLKDCHAEVWVDGRPAKLLHVVKTADASGCYFEAFRGASFEAAFTDRRSGQTMPTCAYELSVWVDGNLINREVVSPDDSFFRRPPDDSKRTFHFSGQLTNEREVTKLRFADIDYKDDSTDPTLCRDKFAASGVGEIALTYCRVENLDWVEPVLPDEVSTKTYQKECRPLHSLNLVPAGKADAPCVPWRSDDRLDEFHTPLVTFSFRYETREELQSLKLVPDPALRDEQAERRRRIAIIAAAAAGEDTPQVKAQSVGSTPLLYTPRTTAKDKGKRKADMPDGASEPKRVKVRTLGGGEHVVETIVILDTDEEQEAEDDIIVVRTCDGRSCGGQSTSCACAYLPARVSPRG